MFTIQFATTTYRPDLTITLRNNVDGWDVPIAGLYQNDAWLFNLDEAAYPQGLAFKFVLEQVYWMNGNNLFVVPQVDQIYTFDQTQVQLPPIKELHKEIIVDNGYVQQLLFQPNIDKQNYDVIIIGSGVGGGVLADQLADLGADVLVLEAGSYLFPTHVANLPRMHKVGQFDKHVWNLFDQFKVLNYENVGASEFKGAQAFNLGGRSLFWGGLIPRMTWWELEAWPQNVRWYLEDTGYQRAEDLLNRIPMQPSTYHRETKRVLQTLLPDYTIFDAPMAIQRADPELGTIPTGMFSTADLLTESRLTDDPAGNQHLTVNLNHVVVKLEQQGQQITGVTAYDLISNTTRTYHAKQVVLCAGTVESTKIAQMSQLADPNGNIGTGLTDHPICFTHFAIPFDSPRYNPNGASKILMRHKQASGTAHSYNIVLELGADFNQGRYLDPDLVERHRQVKGNQMLCEIVFLFNTPLKNDNTIQQVGPSYVKPQIQMGRSPLAPALQQEANDLKDRIINAVGGEALVGDDLALKLADLGGVAHEVGTLRMGTLQNDQEANDGVVDTNLKFVGYNNLYVCDLSVFPSSPAANPTLTLVALAFRLAEHVKKQV